MLESASCWVWVRGALHDSLWHVVTRCCREVKPINQEKERRASEEDMSWHPRSNEALLHSSSLDVLLQQVFVICICSVSKSYDAFLRMDMPLWCYAAKLFVRLCSERLSRPYEQMGSVQEAAVPPCGLLFVRLSRAIRASIGMYLPKSRITYAKVVE